ncbi:NTP transferase domain-containing protein [Paenibacillus filicis]|uniref:NTP transferase domain-containing protein n=1 Tax=Paenibacillus gyeongsangnamensis TaxID=3388067 RepID=A0ABT4Q369_9BACL|nr:NTP transferase domain-containing protein [Paenibacillus filicis]MCZ8511328.1 NTP transferase domain-containing protein [Paenibacillus filicis]
MTLSGIILAGGPTRIVHGVALGLLPLSNGTVLGEQIARMQCVCSEVVMVTNEPRAWLEHVPRSVRVITDYYPERGPLGGLHAALALSKGSEAWVTAMGMPLLSSAAALFLLEHLQVFGYDAVFPSSRGKISPYGGMIRRSCLDELNGLMSVNERRWESFFARLRWAGAEEAMLADHGVAPGWNLRI